MHEGQVTVNCLKLLIASSKFSSKYSAWCDATTIAITSNAYLSQYMCVQRYILVVEHNTCSFHLFVELLTNFQLQRHGQHAPSLLYVSVYYLLCEVGKHILSIMKFNFVVILI